MLHHHSRTTPTITFINDIRPATDFKTYTFSNFKRSEVKKELLECLYNKKPQQASYWVAELICSGHFADIWEIVLSFMSKYIHLGNPKLPIYLEMRYNSFCAIMEQYTANSLHARNSAEIRRLMTEIICVLCFSNRKNALENIKFSREHEFDIENITEKLAAPSQEYLGDCFRKRDPPECIIPTNEFAYSLAAKDSSMACYWLEWMLEFDATCKRRKEPCTADRRYDIPVARKYQEDAIWIFWDVLYAAAATAAAETEDETAPAATVLPRIMGALITLFCINYTSGCARRRRHIMYFAIHLITETVVYQIEMISNKKMMERIIQNIDAVYKMLKENEDKNMDYLYANMGGGGAEEMEQTMRRLEILTNSSIGDAVPHRGGGAGAAAVAPL